MNILLIAFQTKSKSVTLLDAPGHRDFIPNMISGAYQVSKDIMILDAYRGFGFNTQ